LIPCVVAPTAVSVSQPLGGCGSTLHQAAMSDLNDLYNRIKPARQGTHALHEAVDCCLVCAGSGGIFCLQWGPQPVSWRPPTTPPRPPCHCARTESHHLGTHITVLMPATLERHAPRLLVNRRERAEKKVQESTAHRAKAKAQAEAARWQACSRAQGGVAAPAAGQQRRRRW
jgi:hypothetical protein